VTESGSGARTLLVLWDVDHTLIENHGVNKETYAAAFRLLTGRVGKYPAETDGRTEPEIMRNMLLRHGIQVTAEHVVLISEVLEAATGLNAPALRRRGHELPGAREALTILQNMPGIVQSVLTGNIRANAFTKLSSFRLDQYFDLEVGGYGTDNELRENLVGIAQQRASAKYATRFDKNTTVLIGDTPRDVQAGCKGGAHVVAVASGSHTMDALRRSGAEVVLPDLRDTRAVVTAVTGFRD
jgi:phosphoglycolate phosphatase-like HAD superfamily hydrolase